MQLQNYPWPGNVRELENKVKRAVIMAETNQITSEDLELQSTAGVPIESESLNLRHVREEADKRALKYALSSVDNNVSKASEILGVSRPTLYDLMNKYGIK
jgi:two-component system NtrC family response regulator